MNTRYNGPVGDKTLRCDLCGRACQTVIREFRDAPHQPAETLCHRRRCWNARRDAKQAQEWTRYRWADFRRAVRERYDNDGGTA